MGMLDGKISRDDINRVKNMKSHGDYEDGFESESLSNDFGDLDDMFNTDGDDLDSLFGDSSSDGFGSGGDSLSGDSFGGFGGSNDPFADAFGGSSGGFNSGGFFGNQQTTQQNVPKEKDRVDKAIDMGIELACDTGSILLDMIKSFKIRSADDFAYLSRNLIISGISITPLSLILGLIGTASSAEFLTFRGFPLHLLICGIQALSVGVAGIGVSALVLSKKSANEERGIDNIPDIPDDDDNFTNRYEEEIGTEFDEMFGDEFDSLFESDPVDKIDDDPVDSEDDEEDGFKPNVNISSGVNYDDILEDIESNQLISRESLFAQFVPLLPTCNPDFSENIEIDKDSDDFIQLETMCLKALSYTLNCELDEVDSCLECAYENKLSYELRMKRVRKLKKTDEFATQLETLVKDDVDDDSKTVTVGMVGDLYKIIITKGEKVIVTLGDIFRQQECKDFFLDRGNKIPIITGITGLGKVELNDAKIFDSIMITGMSRSGKSWYILSILMSMMLFNSPEQVQICLIDPKDSVLFKNIALLPHVCGLHSTENALAVINEIVEVEGPRRAKLLKDNECDDIWALWNKGIILPVLYIVIDEYMSINDYFAKMEKPEDRAEFEANLSTIITQYPSKGIRIIITPHRAQNVVPKTIRNLIHFTACVRAKVKDVQETINDTKWNRALINPGDMALSHTSLKAPMFMKGATLTTSDEENIKFIKAVAKAFYKIGVEIPDMSTMRVAVNQDKDAIRDELSSNARLIQFDASDLSDDKLDSALDDIDKFDKNTPFNRSSLDLDDDDFDLEAYLDS